MYRTVEHDYQKKQSKNSTETCYSIGNNNSDGKVNQLGHFDKVCQNEEKHIFYNTVHGLGINIWL